MGRNILFITTDQQRYDSLGCNGNVTRTPVADRLAAEGINYRRAHCQNPVCMPSRTTMFTGQHPLTHGCIANGVAYSSGEQGIASWLKRQGGYRTALIGKSHFEPMLDLFLQFRQNQLAAEGSTGPWLGFDHVELAIHGPVGGTHYTKWIMENYPELTKEFGMALDGKGGGDTGAPEITYNSVPREIYHTDWIAERTLQHLDSLDDEDDWFIWMSFPDPHHPFDPPAEEARRHNWRDIELPRAYPQTDSERQKILSKKPKHWLEYYLGRFNNPEGGPADFTPCNLSADQLRELHAVIYAENELIDEACGRVLDRIAEKGWMQDTDIFFTSDHGDMQGDFGFMFKGPFHVDSLMRVPYIWRPAPVAGVKPTEITDPVGHVDLFPTFCDIADVPHPQWLQGQSLPQTTDDQRERVLTTWDSQYRRVGMHLRTLHRDGLTITQYLPSTTREGGRFPFLEAVWGNMGKIPRYGGNEGELYDHKEDPNQFVNLWDDPKYKSLKSDLLADLNDNMPPSRKPPLKVVMPV